jgi:alpha/beta superfamily hydrolase
VLGGFSFGSVMASRVGGTDERVRALFVLGLPVRSLEDTSYLDGVTKPRLFVQGEHDVYGGGDAMRSLVERLSPPCELLVVPGADHFFAGHLDALQAAVDGWAARRPWA